MGIRVKLPELEDWKAQVKCQAGCPVSTDAGRYVQLIAEGRRRGGLPRRPRAESLRLGLRPRLRRALRGRLPPRQHRRAGLDPRAQALRHRAVRRRVDPARHAGSAARRSRHRRGQPLRAATCRWCSTARRQSRPPAGRRRKVAVIGAGPAGSRRRSRPGAAGLRRHRLRGRRRAGRHDALRHPRVPPAADADPRRDRQDRLASGVTLQAEHAADRRASASPSCAQQGFDAVFLSVGVSRGPRSADPWRRARRRREGRRLPAQHQPRLPDEPGPARRRDRRRLRGLRRRAHGAAARAARRSRRRPRPSWAAETDARLKEAIDSARAALRGGATEVTIVSLESFDEMPVLRTTQGHEEFEEAAQEGVRFLTRRGPQALPRRRPSDGRRAARRALGVRRERPLRARNTTTRTC